MYLIQLIVQTYTQIQDRMQKSFAESYSSLCVPLDLVHHRADEFALRSFLFFFVFLYHPRYLPGHVNCIPATIRLISTATNKVPISRTDVLVICILDHYTWRGSFGMPIYPSTD